MLQPRLAAQFVRAPWAVRHVPKKYLFGTTRAPKTRNLNILQKSEKNFKVSPRQELSIKTLTDQSKIIEICFRSAAIIGFSVTLVGISVVIFFIFDASTYHEDLSHTDIQIPGLALKPRKGGPKNLPIAELLIDDNDRSNYENQIDKPRLVILGGGWGSVALLKALNPNDYHVTVVSPHNYFLFTPMLPSATVGTLEFRSLVEPIRRIVSTVQGHFIRALAEDVEFSEKLIELSQKDENGNEYRFYLPYDKLVIGVGSSSNTHGVKGLENCHLLKDIGDARHIKNHILTNLEFACLPTTSDEERRRLLSFVICGGGPTGVEFAAELSDLLNDDLTLHFPRLLRNEVSVHLIQSRGHILNTYDEKISKYAEQRFARDRIEILTDSRVKEVLPDKIIFSQKCDDGQIVTKELPMGFCLWSTGVSQTEFVKRISASLGSAQTNRHALETDTHLRLNGAPLGDVYAIGDCSTVQNNITDHIVTFLRTLAWKKGKDPERVQIDYDEWRDIAHAVRRRFPQAAVHLKYLNKLFKTYDIDKSGTLDFSELQQLLLQIDKKLTSLPATAQRAHQQGQYLGRKFNKLARVSAGLTLNGTIYADVDEAVYKAFDYQHLGSLAYVGNSAVFDFGGGRSFTGGLWAVYAWRSIYFAQSVSMRTRILLAMDWAKRALFGRDMMNW
ncbi:Bgt-60043 [Blumeria graminis f. sp. tritici]|uniref:Bgt-60043 n=1 Tax=Blumeria graminis f. sp. tritici TaxID=62690 RepID=A0A9X9L7K4_BLUGR|nr:Bgt-60043 [Blumeria graminis f. sp. tritici]